MSEHTFWFCFSVVVALTVMVLGGVGYGCQKRETEVIAYAVARGCDVRNYCGHVQYECTRAPGGIMIPSGSGE